MLHVEAEEDRPEPVDIQMGMRPEESSHFVEILLVLSKSRCHNYLANKTLITKLCQGETHSFSSGLLRF